RIEKSEGPDPDKLFYSVAILDGKVIGRGRGRSKKSSEQVAAKNALKEMYGLRL
ncbi:MAG: ribonuclease III, partial [Actinobacteria bacterium]|nr:ribonuclease III [Actinomycetota bacterium]